MTATVTPTQPAELLAPMSAVELHGAKAMALTNAPVASMESFDQFRFALEPASFNDAFKLAAIVAKVGMYGCSTPEGALVRLLTGRALGLPATVALQHVYDVNGRPSLSAKLKMTLTMRHPECEKFEHIESDSKHAVYVIQRKGQPEKRFEFRFEQAIAAKLVKPDSNWEKWPSRMCQARASSEASDVVFPDACMGLPTLEEAIDMGADTAPPTVAGPVQQVQLARDFDAEFLALKTRIANASTKDEKRAAHAAVVAFAAEAGEPYATEIKAHWNTVHATKKNGDAPEQGKLV
jgi:hypothetical protein